MDEREGVAAVDPLRIMLVEDDDFSRVTLSAALAGSGFDVVAAVADAKSAIAACVDTPADVGVFDLDLGPGPTGLDVARGVRRLRPNFGIVILTSYEDPRLLSVSLKALPSGATYVVKQSLTDMDFLVAAIQGSVGGVSAAPPPRVDLTDAQVETLRLVACGLTNAEIAKVRVVEEKSVEQAISRTSRRLGLPSDGSVNQRVALARSFYTLIGSSPPAHPGSVSE